MKLYDWLLSTYEVKGAVVIRDDWIRNCDGVYYHDAVVQLSRDAWVFTNRDGSHP
jgi:hypothetical protein